MTHEISIPMTREMYDELDDAFIDDDKVEDARQFVWQLIRGLCRDAKLGKMAKSCSYQAMNSAGSFEQKTEKLKDISETALPSDPAWLPEQLEGEEVSRWTHKVSDRTWEYLELFSKFASFRQARFEASMVQYEEQVLKDLREEAEKSRTSASKRAVDDHIKASGKARVEREKQAPRCIEQAVYVSIWQQLFNRVAQNVDAMFDKENEELYPKKEESKP